MHSVETTGENLRKLHLRSGHVLEELRLLVQDKQLAGLHAQMRIRSRKTQCQNYQRPQNYRISSSHDVYSVYLFRLQIVMNGVQPFGKFTAFPEIPNNKQQLPSSYSNLKIQSNSIHRACTMTRYIFRRKMVCVTCPNYPPIRVIWPHVLAMR